MMRASIPAFFILSIYLGKAATSLKRGARSYMFIGILLLCSINPLVEISRHIQNNFGGEFETYEYMSEFPRTEENVWTINEQLQSKWWLVSQYIGNRDCFFFKYLANDRK